MEIVGTEINAAGTPVPVKTSRSAAWPDFNPNPPTHVPEQAELKLMMIGASELLNPVSSEVQRESNAPDAPVATIGTRIRVDCAET
jgi:hypothetical protein